MQCIRSFLFILFVCVERGRKGGRRLSKTHEKCPFLVFTILSLDHSFFRRCLSSLYVRAHAGCFLISFFNISIFLFSIFFPPKQLFYFVFLTLFVTICNHLRLVKRKSAPAANTSERFITQSLRVAQFFPPSHFPLFLSAFYHFTSFVLRSSFTCSTLCSFFSPSFSYYFLSIYSISYSP